MWSPAGCVGGLGDPVLTLGGSDPYDHLLSPKPSMKQASSSGRGARQQSRSVVGVDGPISVGPVLANPDACWSPQPSLPEILGDVKLEHGCSL